MFFKKKVKKEDILQFDANKARETVIMYGNKLNMLILQDILYHIKKEALCGNHTLYLDQPSNREYISGHHSEKKYPNNPVFIKNKLETMGYKVKLGTFIRTEYSDYCRQNKIELKRMTVSW